MPTYTFECEPCQGAFDIQRPMSESPGDSHPCPQCGKAACRVWNNTMPLLFGGEVGEDYMLDPKKAALSIARGKVSPGRQRELYSKHVQGMRSQARAAQQKRKGTRRKDGEMRLVGSVPTEYYRCAQRTSGDQHYWNRDPKKTLRKHGLLFDT